MENKLEARNVDVFYGDFKALNDINMKSEDFWRSLNVMTSLSDEKD